MVSFRAARGQDDQMSSDPSTGAGDHSAEAQSHGDKLQTFANALDAHYNLAVGASLLAGHYRDSGNWFAAAGRYHHPTDTVRATAYAQGVFRRIALLQEAA